MWIFPPELCRINEHQKVALDLDPYVKKLLNARRRVVLVNNILQNAQVCERDGGFQSVALQADTFAGSASAFVEVLLRASSSI